MAQATVRLPVTNKWAYVDSGTPIGVIDITGLTEVSMNEWYGSAPNWKGSQLFFQIEDFPAALSKKRIYYATAKFAFKATHDGTKYRLMHAKEDFDPATLEYSNKPALYGGLAITSAYISASTSTFQDFELSPETSTAQILSEGTCVMLRYPTHVLVQTQAIQYGHSTGIAKLWTLTDGVTLPYIEVTYDDSISIGSSIKVANAPTSGYVNPRESTSFSWIYEKDTSSGYDCFGEDYGQSSATFYWKTSSDESYTAVQISGATQSVTIPANTFPAPPVATEIQWYVEGTDDGGTTSQTPVYSFSTAAGTVSATPVSPKRTVESNNAPITFRWNYSSPDGFAPSRYKFMWKLASSSEWTTLVDSTDVVNEYTFPAYTFPAGEIQWKVIPYNIDGAEGTGQSATFVCYGAPEAPTVYADNVPFATINWQASDQQAYQIKVDDTVYGPYFGTEKSFVLPDYLEDGEHTIGVSVVGSYALWSEWGETTVNVQNVPGAAVNLDAEACRDVELFIDTQDAVKNFLIYRDGTQVAKTNQPTFIDRFVLGEHIYKVINRQPNGYYTASNELTRFACVRNANIALLSGGEWLEIEYTLKSQSDPQYEDSVETTYNHLAGSEYPSAVTSRYRNRKVPYSAVFLFNQADERRTFESMFGKPVIIKFRDGTVLVGVLDSWSKHPVKGYYTSYTFTVTQTEFEDYTDDTQ